MKMKKFFYAAALAACTAFAFVGCSDDEEVITAPSVSVSNVQFTDENPKELFVSGTLSWSAPASTDQVTGYRIYMASSPTERTVLLGEVPVGTNTYAIQDVEALQYFIVVAVNQGNESTVGASVVIADFFVDDSISAVYILNSGKMGNNNASLTMYNVMDETTTPDYFKAQNGRGLGDTAQDLIQYGEKLYIAVYGESTIEVTDLEAKSIKQIKTEGQPRALAADGGKIYISYYNGYVARLDTASLEVEAKVKVGRNPEQLAIQNNKLYVANSGGMDYNTEVGYDKTVSVVDLASFTETKQMEVALNPCNLQVADKGIYLISMGNYGDVPNTLQWIDTDKDEASVVEAMPNATEMAIMDNKLYAMYSQYDANWNQIITFNGLDLATQTTFDWTQEIAKPYKVSTSGALIYVTESDYKNNGTVYGIDDQGKVIVTVEAGLNPLKAIYVSRD